MYNKSANVIHWRNDGCLYYNIEPIQYPYGKSTLMPASNTNITWRQIKDQSQNDKAFRRKHIEISPWDNILG